MWRHLFLLFLCSLAAKNVFGLNCYGTKFNKIKGTDLKPLDNLAVVFEEKYYADDDTPFSANCTHLMKQLEANMNEKDLRCFTAIIKGDIMIVEIKGCAPNEQCDEILNKFLVEGNESEASLECHYCEGDNCNKDSMLNSVAERTYTMIFIALASLVFAF